MIPLHSDPGSLRQWLGRGGCWNPSVWERILSSFYLLPPYGLKNVLFLPALCLSWTPLGFAYNRRANLLDLPEGSRNLQLTFHFQAKEFLICLFCFSGAAGGRAGCGSGTTWWSHPGLRHAQLHPHSHLGAHPPGVPEPGSQERDFGVGCRQHQPVAATASRTSH